MTDPHLALTEAFNRGRMRALLGGRQAAALRGAGEPNGEATWIVHDDDGAIAHVLGVLGSRGALYLFGAPLDSQWLRGGWSAHFEHDLGDARVRSAFVTRPPQFGDDDLDRIRFAAETRNDPVLGPEPLAPLLLTNRDEDHAVVGALARRMTDPRAQMRWSRDADDLIRLAAEQPALVGEVVAERPLLARISEGRDALNAALETERREQMRAHGELRDRYRAAAEPWEAAWPEVARDIADLSLSRAHDVVVSRARGLLPFYLPPAGR